MILELQNAWEFVTGEELDIAEIAMVFKFLSEKEQDHGVLWGIFGWENYIEGREEQWAQAMIIAGMAYVLRTSLN